MLREENLAHWTRLLEETDDKLKPFRIRLATQEVPFTTEENELLYNLLLNTSLDIMFLEETVECDPDTLTIKQYIQSRRK